MDFDNRDEDDEVALARRRANLRAFVEDVAEAVQALPMPDSYLEAERSVRAVTVADRFIANVPDEDEEEEEYTPPSSRHGRDDTSPCRHREEKKGLSPTRKALRGYADRLMDAVCRIPKPDCFLEAERAGRYALACDRMLEQLYAAPKTKKSGADYSDADDAYARTGSHDRDLSIFFTKYKGKRPADWQTNVTFWRDLLAEKLVRLVELRQAANPVRPEEPSDSSDSPAAGQQETAWTGESPSSHQDATETITPPQAEPRIRTFGPYPFRPPP